MKKILFLLTLTLVGLTCPAQWQPANPTGAVFTEQNTGTTLILTGSSVNITTSPAYTGVASPVRWEVVVYDSIGHRVDKFEEYCSNVSKRACEGLLYYTAFLNGEFAFTIYCTAPYDRNNIYSYSIIIPTWYLQVLREEFLKQFVR